MRSSKRFNRSRHHHVSLACRPGGLAAQHHADGRPARGYYGYQQQGDGRSATTIRAAYFVSDVKNSNYLDDHNRFNNYFHSVRDMKQNTMFSSTRCYHSRPVPRFLSL